MKEITVREYGRIQRGRIGAKLLRSLHRFDLEQAASSGDCIFDWGRLHFIHAKNYVGVVQVPGLRIEILPKIDHVFDVSGPEGTPGDRVLAQSNLLYMLALAKKIPVYERDLASLKLEKMPLLEALIRIFVERLLAELRKGAEHAYVRREENVSFVRGKLLLSHHVRENIARKDRLFVSYDEFNSDTLLNRIIKAACRRLSSLSVIARTRQRLSEAILHLSEVRDVEIRPHNFKKLLLSRNTARFQQLLDFCQIVLTDSAISPAAGSSSTFSLLFPMEVLFEEFIARFIRRNAVEFGYDRDQVHIQAAKRRKWLLRDAANKGRFRMKPDIVFDGKGSEASLILDTKWKRLKSDAEDAKNGVQQSDLYQLYAYAHRYKSADNVLLFPKVNAVSPKRYHVEGDETKQLRLEFVDLNYDLRKNQHVLRNELQQILASHI